MYKINIEQIQKLLIEDSIEYKEIPQSILDEAYVYAIFKDCVRVGKLKNNEVLFYDECEISKLIEIRLFNKDCEYKAIYSTAKEKYIIRVRTDEDMPFFTNEMYVFGERLEKVDGDFVTVVQDGNYLSLPITLEGKPNDPVSIKLISHDYYSFNDKNVMYLADNRLVDIIDEKGKEKA